MPPSSVPLDPFPLSWADLVFHVLAHVRGHRHLASSVFDPMYIRFVEEHLGPSKERMLAQDAEALAQVVKDHQTLASIQLLAWLHATTEQSDRCSEQALSELNPSQVEDAELLGGLLRLGPSVEVLRCAALIEREAWANLPTASEGVGDLQEALNQVVRASPLLQACSVRIIRSLCLRGRVRRREIWVGHPMNPKHVSVHHVSWQAAHEASVREVVEGMVRMALSPDHSTVEHVATVLLAVRAGEAGLATSHRGWFDHFRTPPSMDPGSLGVEERKVWEACRH